MNKVNHHLTSAQRRERRVRGGIRGTTERPRLTVFRSNKNIALQVIDDSKGRTLVAASSMGQKTKGTKTEVAKQIAEELIKKMQKAKISKLVFDRGSYRYHGRVRVIAETMRAADIQV